MNHGWLQCSCWALLSLVGSSVLSLPVWAEPLPPVPVFFAPWTVSPAFQADEKLLRTTLTARLVGRGRVVETASAATERLVGQCVAAINREVNAESCWIRVGQGQGAQELVGAELEGDSRRCTLTVRRTHLETRVTSALHVGLLTPCTLTDLQAEAERAAAALDPVERGSAGTVILTAAAPSRPSSEVAGLTSGSAAPQALTTLSAAPPAPSPTVTCWVGESFSGPNQELRTAGRLSDGLRGAVSSLATTGAGWIILRSGTGHEGSKLVVRAGVTIPQLGRIPKVNVHLGRVIVKERDWDDEIETVEFWPEQEQPPLADEGRLTVIDRQGHGYRKTAAGATEFSF